MFFVLLLQISFQYLSPSLEKRIEVFDWVTLLMGLGLMMGISIGRADRMGASGSGFQRYFFPNECADQEDCKCNQDHHCQ
jgi:hypothetical protein